MFMQKRTPRSKVQSDARQTGVCYLLDTVAAAGARALGLGRPECLTHRDDPLGRGKPFAKKKKKKSRRCALALRCAKTNTVLKYCTCCGKK